MTAEKDVTETNDFKSTTELTSNPGFQSSLSIATKTDDKTYNPFEHRNLEHPNSTIGSILHLLKACLGTGVLAMPAAFKNSGLAAGTIGTALSGLICVHTMHILVKVSQDVCVDAKKPSLSYAGTCGAAFAYGPKRAQPWANFVKQLVDWSMTFAYLGVLCVYVVFIGSSFKEVLDFYFPEVLSIRACCALTLVPLVLICQIRNLKYLVPFSALANALVFVVFVITLYYIFIGLPSVEERDMVAPVSQWPLFFSTVIFAMEGIGVIMPVENEMANPKRFLGCPGVLNISMVTVLTLYMIVGFFGYVQYGDNVKGSVTLNLPEEDIVAQVAKILMALVIFFTYTLQIYVPMEMITRMRVGKESKYENLVQILIRTLIVTGSVVVAIAFPNLELAISFVGAVFFSTLGLLFPAVIHTVYNWEHGLGKFNYILYKNIIIMFISVVASVSGAYASIASNVSGEANHVNVTIT